MRTRLTAEHGQQPNGPELAPAEEGGPARRGRPRYLDVVRAADYLGVTVSFVRRLVLERRVRYYKLGKYLRFDPTDLDALVTVSRVDPVPSRPTRPGGR